VKNHTALIEKANPLAALRQSRMMAKILHAMGIFKNYLCG